MFFWNKSKKEKKAAENVELVLLTTLHSGYELGIIKSILEDNKIPYIIKDVAAGGYLRIGTGTVVNDAYILVEKSHLEKAKNLIGGICSVEESNTADK